MNAIHSQVERLLSIIRNYEKQKSAGLFLGVNEFAVEGETSSELAPLDYAVDDAIDMAHLFICEFPLLLPEKVVVAVSGDPNKAESIKNKQELISKGVRFKSTRYPDVLKHIERAQKDSGKNGYLIYSFSSHGFINGGRNYIVCENTVLKRLESALPVDQVTAEAKKSLDAVKIIFVDACRAQRDRNKSVAGAGEGVDRFDANGIEVISGCFGLYSAVDGGYSYENPTRKNGVFTSSLLDGLRGRAEAFDGFITPQTLSDYVNQAVKQWFRIERDETIQSAVTMKIDGGMNQQPILPKPELTISEAEENRRLAQINMLKNTLNSLASEKKIKLSSHTKHSIESHTAFLTVDEIGEVEKQLAFFQTLGQAYSDTFDLWWRSFRKLDQNRLGIYSGFFNIIPKVEELIDNSRQGTLDVVVFSPRLGSLHCGNSEVTRRYEEANRSSYVEAVDRVWKKLSANVHQIIVLDPQNIVPDPDEGGKLVSPLKIEVLNRFTERTGYRTLDADQIALEALADAREIYHNSSDAEVCFIKELPLQLIVARLKKAEDQKRDFFGCLLLMVASGKGLARLKPGDEIGIYFVIDEETKKLFDNWIEALDVKVLPK